MNQCKRLKWSDGSGWFCCNKIAAGNSLPGWPLPAFCERLADGAELETDLKNWRGSELVSGWIFVLIFRIWYPERSMWELNSQVEADWLVVQIVSTLGRENHKRFWFCSIISVHDRQWVTVVWGCLLHHEVQRNIVLGRLYAKSACPEACLVLHNEGLPDNCIVPVWDWAYFYPSVSFFTVMAKFGSVIGSCS